ncbi:MAG: serine/threonine-protein kinase [Pirellulales bacterium]
MGSKFERSDTTIDSLPEEAQDRLARILDYYLVAMELGSPIDPEELLARHPEDAVQLRGYLSGLELFHAAAVAPQPISLVSGKLGPEQTIGDFRLIQEIGRGGMGVVYEAEQVSLRRRVALKILPFTAGHDEKQISRFKNEAQAAAQIKHPNIVPVFAVGEQNGVHYYAMQLVEGQSLTTMLADMHHGSPPSTVGSTAPNYRRTTRGAATISAANVDRQHDKHLACPEMSAGGTSDHLRVVARLGVQAAIALHAAHDFGIVHRDVKPSNLLIDDQGKLWVTDFGLARCREHAGLTQTGDVLGTMRYMSPEQALGRGGLIDHRTDVYSLGVTLYELATLHHPAGDATDAQLLWDRRRFASKPLRHWNRHIPVDFQTIILKAIAEFPHERFATAQEFADDLNRFLEGKPILASPPSLVCRVGKWARRHRGVVYAAAVILLVAFVGQTVNNLLLAKQTGETERALAAAQENLHQARAVLDRFGARYAEQLAAIPGAEGVRSQMLEESLKFYQQFETQTADDPSLKSDLALAYNRMGTLSEKLGNSEEALTRHLAARKLWESRIAEEPANSESARNLALCENNIGLLLAEFGRGPEAVESLEHAQRMQKELLGKTAKSAILATELATTSNNLGLVLRQAGRRSEAVEQFRAAIAMQQPLTDNISGNETALRVLAASYSNLGSLHDATEVDAAAEYYHKAITLQRQLVESNPINRLYQGDLARTYNNLGFVFARSQNWQNAELCYLDAVKIQEHLVKQSPLAGSYTRDLAISYNNLGMVQSRDGRFDEAEASFRQALSLQRRLLAVVPLEAKTLSNLGGVYNNLGLLFDQQQRFADAENNYKQAVHFQRQAFESSSDDARCRSLLSNHYTNYAKCLRSQKKLQAANQIFEQRKSLLAGQPHSSDMLPQN